MYLELEPYGVAHGGYAVARVGAGPDTGMVVFVAGAIPGEKVRAEVTARAKRHLSARTVEVLEPSPDRVAHFWPEADLGVGGADLGHVSPERALVWKGEVLTDLLARIGGPGVAEEAGEVRVVPTGPPQGWRTRVSFVADEAGSLAMRREGSHDLVRLTRMPLAVAAIEEMGLFEPGRFNPGEKVRAVAPSGSEPVLVRAAGVFSAGGSPEPRHVREVLEWSGGLERYQVDAAGFWQAHTAAPRLLTEAVTGALSPDSNVLELYSGAGLFTRPLSRRARRVVGLEGSKRAAKDAAKNLRDFSNSRTRHTAVTAYSLQQAAAELGEVGAVVLDPPRSGAGPRVLAALTQTGAREVVMVSCDPATAARDLRSLEATYRIEELLAFDLFPGTHHIEMVVRLRRRGAAEKYAEG